jgi:hypothetical protein
MKIKNLSPDEILTTTDFPVYNTNTLKIYFKICKENLESILPPTPVIPFSVGLPLSTGKDKKSKDYNKRIKEYLKKNKKVKYLMVDGSHKTTALTLTGKKIHAMILKTDKDILEVKDLIKVGEIFGIYKIKSTREELKEKAKHYKNTKFFETVKDKTKRMVKEKVIPNYMIDHSEGLNK